MSLSRKPSLTMKLMACFGAVALLSVLVAAIDLVGLQAEREQIDSVTIGTIPRVFHLDAARSAVEAAMRDARGAALAGSNGGRAARFVAEATASEAAAQGEFAAFEAGSPLGSAALALTTRTRADLQRWRDLDARVVRLVAMGQSRAGAALALGPEQAAGESLSADFDALVAFEGPVIAQARERTDRVYAIALAELIAISVLVGALSLSLGVVIARSVARPLGAMQYAAERLASGTLADLARAMGALARGAIDEANARVDLVPMNARVGGEVGDMVASFTAMQGAISSIATSLDAAREGLRESREALETRNDQLHREVAEREAVQAAMRHQIAHDALTELPNRAMFLAMLHDAGGASSASSLHAVLLLDIDRFKEVNDTLGHANGDLVLRMLGARLRGLAPAEAIAARMGADEFALLLPNASSPQAIAVARAIQHALAEPFIIEGISFESPWHLRSGAAPAHEKPKAATVKMDGQLVGGRDFLVP